MRRLTTTEVRKRGCEWCADAEARWKCPYEECPYKVLDKYDTYGQFLRSKDARFSNLEMWNNAIRNI